MQFRNKIFGRILSFVLVVSCLGGCGSTDGTAAESTAGSSGSAVSGSSAQSDWETEKEIAVGSSDGTVEAVSSDSSSSTANVESISGSSGDVQDQSLAADPVTQTPEPTEPADKGITVALDPGHQAPDVDMSAQEPNAPGSSVMKTKATGGTSGTTTGVPEYQLNLNIALKVRDLLEAQGYGVVMTREDNETAISNAERATLANDSGASVMVRIHANGSEDASANGALALIGSQENPYVGSLYDDSLRLADSVLQAYCASTGMANDGVTTSDTMTGINWSKIPVMILEMGFMTNPTDDTNMEDPAYQDQMAQGIVQGIQDYFGQ